MAVQTVLTLTHAKETIGTVQGKMLKPATKVQEQLVALRGFFHALAGRDRAAKLVVQVNSGDAVAASGTITLSSFAAADTLTVGSEVFTASATPSGANQFLSTGTDTTRAAAAVVKINAHANLAQTVTSANVAGVITVTSKVPGKIGNYINIAISAHGSVSAAVLASGADAVTYSAQNTYHAGV